jgi:hypothetical protein
MAVANTLAYYDTAKITSVKSVVLKAPGVYPRVKQMKGVSLS